MKNEHCNVFSSGFQSSFPSLFAWKRAEEKMQSTVYNKVIKLQISGDDMDKNNKSESLNGVYGAICEIIGFENTVKLYNQMKGSQINFPTRLYSKEYVALEAEKTYDGTSDSLNKIATEYNYSERTIRKLLKKKNEELSAEKERLTTQNAELRNENGKLQSVYGQIAISKLRSERDNLQRKLDRVMEFIKSLGLVEKLQAFLQPNKRLHR